ncbi:MAG: type II toxin-antitoxin system HigB family toxin [Ruegeria sp.]
MRIIARHTLIDFYKKHPVTKAPLEHWYQVAKASEWATPLEVIGSFSKAKVVSEDRVRFEVQGGNFRMIVAFDFDRGIAFIKFLGTHAEYDKINAETVNLF